MSRRRRSVELPSISTGLRAAWHDGYGLEDLRKDVMAGLTIGTVAVPLSMALAIATGVPPQHGLYTAIVAGAIIALTGGSRFNVSGPTAAFVVILFPIVQQYGLGGLLIASMMAGMILVTLGVTRMGRLIQFVPYPVVLGFTAGIAVVIAVLQIPDFFGLETGSLTEHFIENVWLILTSFPTLQPLEFGVGIFTLLVMLIWPRLHIPIPAPLIGLVVGAIAAYFVNQWLSSQETSAAIDTIASRFTWEANGETGIGIPPIPPTFMAPWLLPGPDGEPLQLSFDLIRALLGPAFAIAILGAIESLLCAVVADGLTKTKHDPNAELIGQGLGNIAAPLFGGITATAAIARTATNIRSGARSPIAAVIHALVVLLAIIALAGLLGMVPMAALAALLFIIAWNMSEARHALHTLRSAPPGDVAILVTCFGLTVIFDMVLAVAVGIGLAAALFIRRMASLTQTDHVETKNHPMIGGLPAEVAVYDVNGPLFFGAAEKALSSLHLADPKVKTIIIDMHDVPSMDGTAIVALQSLIAEMTHQGIGLILVGLQPRIITKLRRAGVRKVAGSLSHCRNLTQAGMVALRWHKERGGQVPLPEGRVKWNH
ncbi:MULTISPECIES: C4-dicarboxylic acid transporter DauA [unclassified Ectothiorhodospira]|uniref:C4-dicarboxylic acid transporter DauA n=1 Tax=unclassified Ectothiorhodospira TaxID=2684909 RepID=UPI001EE8AD79|nr:MULTISPECIES: C4-dicarboxylic acid transporter DauA [unclassified Ectothiorhodospira]MCG5515372.1 C4-dicarboxylic acid transporter DauA [Ectothiorhodospira sp. 9100]MCG5519250.1 C4-dicarboxylic acid transporter DauA [Ectothiorhodospira sp. 9905]